MDQLRITMHSDVALYILNHKRASVTALEEQFGLSIVILADASLTATEHRAERVGWQGGAQRKSAKPAKTADSAADADADADAEDDETRPEEQEASDDDQPRRRKRGRRGGRRRRRRGGEGADNGVEAESAANDDEAQDGEAGDSDAAASLAAKTGSPDGHAAGAVAVVAAGQRLVTAGMLLLRMPILAMLILVIRILAIRILAMRVPI